jgi:hypothetical protein
MQSHATDNKTKLVDELQKTRRRIVRMRENNEFLQERNKGDPGEDILRFVIGALQVAQKL